MLTLIQGSFSWSTLRFWVCNTIEIQVINLKGRYHYGNYKRTWQEVSAKLLFYLYKLQVVCTINN